MTSTVTEPIKPRRKRTKSSRFAPIQSLGIQGEVQLELGQTERALKSWQRAETLYTEIGDRNGITQSRINQAQALQVLGFYRRALATLTKLSYMLQSQPDSLTKAVELRSLSFILTLS